MMKTAFLQTGVVCLSLYATPASSETLADALAAAYRHNPTLAASRYDLQAQDERIVQAKAELRPTVTVELDGEYSRSVLGKSSQQSNPFAAPSSTATTDTGSVIVTQPVYTGGRATADRHVAEASVGQSREALRTTEQDLALSVITAYLDIRRYRAEVRIWSDSIAELEKIDVEIHARADVRDLTLTDVSQGEANLQISREQMLISQQSLKAAEADYEMLVGHAPSVLDEPNDLPAAPPTLDDSFDMAQDMNPDLTQTRFAEKVSREQISVASSQGRPTLGLQGRASINGQTYPYRLYDQDKGYAGTVILRIPISNGGAIASQIREARQRNGGDQMRVEAARISILRDVTNAWNAVSTVERQLGLLAVQQKAAITQMEGMTAEYHYGLRSTFDVIYAQQQLTSVQINLLDYERESYVSHATLLRRVGGLDPKALATQEPEYDATSHLRRVRNANWIPWEVVAAQIDKALSAPPKGRPPLVGTDHSHRRKR